jgi:hypothetical protein
MKRDEPIHRHSVRTKAAYVAIIYGAPREQISAAAPRHQSYGVRHVTLIPTFHFLKIVDKDEKSLYCTWSAITFHRIGKSILE